MFLYYSFISMSMNVFIILIPSGSIRQARLADALGDDNVIINY
jgi:hypothetical protein